MIPSHADHPADTRTRLLEAAILCFAEKGFEGAGIREIAHQAQANSALVQYHFGGKENLYEEAFRHMISQNHSLVAALPPPPSPGDPRARTLALEGLRDHIAAFAQELMACLGNAKGGELDRAAALLWSREMQDPRPALRDLLTEMIRPYTDHLEGCLRILRPDLDPGRLFEMGMSIHGMMLSYRTHLGLARALARDPEYPRDLGALIAHFIEFSIRGLGLPDPLPPQGA